METNLQQTAATSLQQFVGDYLEAVGGAWDEIEPEVLDVLLPTPGQAGEESLRLTFEPEALPEHPGAQLATFGSPFIDRLLEDAMARGCAAHAYRTGLNLAPYDLTARIRRAVNMGDGLDWRINKVRARSFWQAIFWFRATFVSDQKETELLPTGFELYYGRQVRHLEQLLDEAHLADQPAEVLPEERRWNLEDIFVSARDRVQRTLSSLANVRNRELNERLNKQVARMTRYYADLRAETMEQMARAQKREQDANKYAARLGAIAHEEETRIAELRHKHALQIQLRLLSILVIHQPKLLADAEVFARNKPATPWQLVWDPLTESLEAPQCPRCSSSTFSLLPTKLGQPACPTCAATAIGARTR